ILSAVTSNGSGSFTAQGGNISVLASGNISVAAGDLTLQSQSSSSGTGSITFGDNATISASSTVAATGGRIIATIGALPVSVAPTVGTAPGSSASDWSVSLPNSAAGGNIFYGANGVSLNGSTGSSATINGGVII